MQKKILVVGDPIHELKPGKETTLALIQEAQDRGYEVDFCTSQDICQTNGRVVAEVQPMRLTGDLDDYFDMGEKRTQRLDRGYDVILMRSNPKGYRRINTSYMMDPLADRVLILNDPRGMREMHGKFFTANFPDFIVPYAIVEHEGHFTEFVKTHKDVIVKPVNGYGGAGVARLSAKDLQENGLFERLYNEYGCEPFIVQEYIPAAVKGDKRIILFDGEPVCSILRVPKDASSLANITQGATSEKTELTPREQALCAEIGPILRDYGIFFAGLDMLGDYLSEINVISVGTVVPANALYGIKLEELFWDKLEAKIDAFKAEAA